LAKKSTCIRTQRRRHIHTLESTDRVWHNIMPLS
jgi:hypothetical protein